MVFLCLIIWMIKTTSPTMIMNDPANAPVAHSKSVKSRNSLLGIGCCCKLAAIKVGIIIIKC